MTFVYSVLIAILPVAILAGYVCWKDRHQPEPLRELAKAALLGVLSAPLAYLTGWPFDVLGFTDVDVSTFSGALSDSFFAAAIPEELSKLLMLLLVTFRNKYFDERMDGIVYAVFVSLGFAATENILYVVESDDWLGVGIARAILSVPGHFSFAVVMGYYYALFCYDKQHRFRHAVGLILAPIFWHGAYDTLIAWMSIDGDLGFFIFPFLLAFCVVLWDVGHRRMTKHLKADGVEA